MPALLRILQIYELSDTNGAPFVDSHVFVLRPTQDPELVERADWHREKEKVEKNNQTN